MIRSELGRLNCFLETAGWKGKNTEEIITGILSVIKEMVLELTERI